MCMYLSSFYLSLSHSICQDLFTKLQTHISNYQLDISTEVYLSSFNSRDPKRNSSSFSALNLLLSWSFLALYMMPSSTQFPLPETGVILNTYFIRHINYLKLILYLPTLALTLEQGLSRWKARVVEAYQSEDHISNFSP